MVQFSQTSWQEYSLANVLETLSCAPMTVAIKKEPTIFYTLPASLEPGNSVKYTLVVGFKKITWTGCISAINENRITVRLDRGPFRGFNALHEFESDGSLTRCYDEFSFQGFTDISEEVFSSAMTKANLIYAIASRKDALNEKAIVASRKQTQSFSALGQSATAG